jgi:hypothetical protein
MKEAAAAEGRRRQILFPPLPRAKRWGEGAGGEGQKLLRTAQREMAYPNCCYYSKARLNNW